MSEERREFSPMSLSELNEVLGLTVKEDNFNKVITFLCCLSAYTENSQFNISFNAPSSSGKSYIPIEVAAYFPKEDVKEIAYCSAQAFFHDNENFNKETGTFTVDFERKIVIFIDQPYPDVLHRLRPILSQDKKVIEVKITDKSQKHGLKTKNVSIKGFASVIYCSAALKMDEQEATRFLLLSPETSQEKIKQGVLEALKKESNPAAYRKELDDNTDRKNLMERIIAIKEAKIMEIKIHDTALIARWFLDEHRIRKPRYQRDVKRVSSIIKSHALLNLWNREMPESGVILTDEEDIEVGLSLWEEIAECQELNLSPYVYKIYSEVIEPAYELDKALTIQKIGQGYYKVYGIAIEDWKLRKEVIPMLCAAGKIRLEQNPADKRNNLVIPILSTPDSIIPNDNNIESGVE